MTQATLTMRQSIQAS